MICQKCHKETPDAGDYCTHCGAHREALAIQEDFGPRPKPRRQFAWVPYAWAALALFFIAHLLFDKPAPKPATAKAPGAAAVRAGDRVRLTLHGAMGPVTVPVFTSKAAAQEYQKSAAAGDDVGQRLCLLLRAYLVPSGTHALVRDTLPWDGLIEVRVITGDRAGCVGFAFKHCCRPL